MVAMPSLFSVSDTASIKLVGVCSSFATSSRMEASSVGIPSPALLASYRIRLGDGHITDPFKANLTTRHTFHACRTGFYGVISHNAPRFSAAPAALS